MSYMFTNNRIRPNKLQSKKDKKYHSDYAKFCLSTMDNFIYRRYINIYSSLNDIDTTDTLGQDEVISIGNASCSTCCSDIWQHCSCGKWYEKRNVA